MRVGRILHDHQAVLLRQAQQTVHIAHPPAEVDRRQHAGLRRNPPRRIRRTHQQRLRVDLAEHRLRPHVQRARVAADIPDRGRHELVPWAQPGRKKRTRQRRVPVAGRKHVPAPDILPEPVLELLGPPCPDPDRNPSSINLQTAAFSSSTGRCHCSAVSAVTAFGPPRIASSSAIFNPSFSAPPKNHLSPSPGSTRHQKPLKASRHSARFRLPPAPGFRPGPQATDLPCVHRDNSRCASPSRRLSDRSSFPPFLDRSKKGGRRRQRGQHRTAPHQPSCAAPTTNPSPVPVAPL